MTVFGSVDYNVVKSSMSLNATLYGETGSAENG